MGRTVVKQPNGNYAVFSSVVDDFIVVNATKQELIDMDVEEECEKITERYNAMFESFDKDEIPPPNINRHMTWEEAMERVTEVHGVETAAKSVAEALPDK